MKRILYKYLDWSKPHVRKSFIDSSIYFSNNFSFNDPFDLQLPVLLDNRSPLDWIINSEEKELGRKLSENEVNYIRDYLKKKESLINKSELNLLNSITESNSEIEPKLGVLCLSQIKDSLLMWGHYANSHTGICMGYDAEKLVGYLKSEVNSKVFEYKVEYRNEIPKIDFSMMEDDEYLKQSVIRRVATKFVDWKYEKEVRIIISYFAKKSIIIPKEILTELIFGIKTPPIDIESIQILCKTLYPHIKLLKAQLNNQSFKLDIVEC